jgi:hypothetical protein
VDCHVFLARHDVFSNPKERYKVWHSEFAVVGSEILFLKTKGEAIGAPTRTAPCAFTAIPKEKKGEAIGDKPCADFRYKQQQRGGSI